MKNLNRRLCICSICYEKHFVRVKHEKILISVSWQSYYVLGVATTEIAITGCPVGKWGKTCKYNCASNCLNQTCDKSAGNCTHCESGWSGENCTKLAYKKLGNYFAVMWYKY